MKKIFRLAWLALVFGVLAACSSPPPVDTEVVEEAPEAAVAEVEEVEETAPEPTEPPAEVEAEPTEAAAETEEEPEMAEPAVDGPTHIPATNVEEALVEKPYDQTKGAEDPLLTVIEYGDFQ